MNKLFNAVDTAKELLTDLLTTKPSESIDVKIGLKGGVQRVIRLTNAFKGYDDVRKSINRQTEKYYGEKCEITIGSQKMEFIGGKFSNELLKMLKRVTTEWGNNGDYMNIDDNFDQNLIVVKKTFLRDDITIVDLLPIAMNFVGITPKNRALLAEAMVQNDNFVNALSNTHALIEAERIEKENLELGYTDESSDEIESDKIEELKNKYNSK